jgi:hypothetical protein
MGLEPEEILDRRLDREYHLKQRLFAVKDGP